jgi:hypothetical protein
MPLEWSEYQERVASFFRTLGLDAEVDAHLRGARAEHDVDLAVRFRQHGVDVLWIVECKFWKTSVPKEKVVALQQIAHDTGADRAFLFAESGFQPGAVRAASYSNITLTSLDDLADNAGEIAATARLAAISSAFYEIDRRVGRWFTDSDDRPGPRPGVDFDRLVTLSGRLLALKTNWAKVVAGRFPVPTDYLQSTSVARNLPEFILQAEQLIAEAETELAAIGMQAEETKQKAREVVVDLVARVEALLVSGRAVVQNKGAANSGSKEEMLLRAHADMKAIGDALDEVRSILSGRARRVFFQLRPLLIDGIYLHLMTPSLSLGVWDGTERRVRKALAELIQSLELPLHRLSD